MLAKSTFNPSHIQLYGIGLPGITNPSTNKILSLLSPILGLVIS